MLSQKARYALKALVALSRQPDGVPMLSTTIAARESIPQKFLEQILLELKRQGFIASRRGKTGGYLLARPPQQITYGEVLRLIDGPVAPLPCLSRIAYRRCTDCIDEDACALRQVFAHVADATRGVLDGTSLAGSAPSLPAVFDYSVPALEMSGVRP